MTSTPKGLIALFGEGFKHYHDDIIKTSNAGCQMCKILCAGLVRTKSPRKPAFVKCNMLPNDGKAFRISPQISEKRQIEIHTANYSKRKKGDISEIWFNYHYDERSRYFHKSAELNACEGNVLAIDRSYGRPR